MARGNRTIATRVLGLAGLLAAAALCACEGESRIVRYDPFLARIPGAETGIGPVLDTRGRPDLMDPSNVPMDELRVRNPDGTITLRAMAIRHCMIHVALCLQTGEDDLLYQQMVSEATKKQLRADGKDPKDASLTFLKENYEDLMQLFQRMPAAERSPGVIMTRAGPGQMKLELRGAQADGLRLTALWVVMERGTWRFLWAT